MRNRCGVIQLARLVVSVAAMGCGSVAVGDSSTPDVPPRLIVVTPASLREALAPYVEHRSREFTVEVALLEDVLAKRDGADDPEKLKRFLYDAWKERAARYVLLVGDADVLPVRYMVLDRVTAPAFDYAFYPSDLYYADVAKPDGSFEDWNGAKDGFHARYFGEVRGEKNKNDPINFDDIDYLPELALGRWPVSTSEETAIMVAKMLAFERSVRDGAASSPGGAQGSGAAALRGRSAAFIMVGGWVDARSRMDRMAASLGESWMIQKRYYRGGDERFDTPPPNEEQVVDLLNTGVTLVFHAGHGHDHGWEHCIHTGSLKTIENAKHPAIILSAGCSTARFATLPPYEPYVDIDGVEHAGTNAGQVFDAPPPPPAPYQRGPYNPTGLGEQLLRASENGAAAYFGCNTGSQPCGLTLLDGFAEAIGTLDSPRLGDCWKHAIAHYVERERLRGLVPTDSWYPASIFFQGMKFMLFGDPTLPLP